MRCVYYVDTDCNRTPSTVVVWGCMLAHLHEFVICERHFENWLDSHYRGLLQCPHCYERSEDFLARDSKKILPTAVINY